ncbi:MAG: hypothetical protein ABW007_02985 [Chitinophagaceae bacterium]
MMNKTTRVTVIINDITSAQRRDINGLCLFNVSPPRLGRCIVKCFVEDLPQLPVPIIKTFDPENGNIEIQINDYFDSLMNVGA